MGSAIISDCGRYRYRLDRPGTNNSTSTAIIMVNPSTADADQDDATIRKLRGFGERNEWGRLIVGNLFAYRATDVRDLKRIADPVGPDNDDHLRRIFEDVDRVIFAWGPLSKQPTYHRARWRRVAELASEHNHHPLCIGAPAKCGHPKHPLMLGYDNPLLSWSHPR